MTLENMESYGPHFQIKVLSSLLTHKKFLINIYDILSEKDFNNQAHKWIVKEIVKYYDKYHTTPSLDILKVEVKKVENEVLQVSIKEQLREAYKASEEDLELTDGLDDPGVTTGHKLIYRYNTDAGSTESSLTISLMEGSTVRMTETVDTTDVSSYVTRTYAPTNTTGTIGSYNNLFLRLYFDDSSDYTDSVYISQAYLEIPDAAAGADAVPMALNTYQQMRNK